MKNLFLIISIAALFACNSESETETTRGNTDATDTTTIRDNTINRDTGILRGDTAMRDTVNRRDSVPK